MSKIDSGLQSYDVLLRKIETYRKLNGHIDQYTILIIVIQRYCHTT